MEQEVKQRICEVLKSNNCSITALAKKSNLQQNTLNRQIRGETALSYSTIAAVLSAFPDVDAGWLVSGLPGAGSGDTLRDGIPFFRRPLECGLPADFNACLMADRADGLLFIPDISGDFALVAHGESMVDTARPERSIPDGGVVVLKKVTENALRWGEVYAVATSDGFTVKRLMPGSTPDRVMCCSFNAEYPPFEFALSDICGIARVVAVVNYRLY